MDLRQEKKKIVLYSAIYYRKINYQTNVTLEKVKKPTLYQ